MNTSNESDQSPIVKWLPLIIAVVALVLAGVALLKTNQSAKVETLGVSNFDSITLSGDLNATNVTATTITATNLISQAVAFSGVNATLTGAVTSAYITATNPISMAGAIFTGPIHYGSAATYTSGAPISHGFATTPTLCIVLPVRDVTSTLTITSTMFSSNMATIAIPIRWMCGL